MGNPQKIKAKVKDLISYGNGVYMLIFQLEKKFPRFKAGQFTHLTVDPYDPVSGYCLNQEYFQLLHVQMIEKRFQ